MDRKTKKLSRLFGVGSGWRSLKRKQNFILVLIVLRTAVALWFPGRMSLFLGHTCSSVGDSS